MDSMGGQNLQLILITEKSRGLPLSYVIRKYEPIPDDGENRYAQIIHKESLVRNMFISYPSKFLGILKELTLGKYSETWIKNLNCDRKVIQELQAH